MGPLYQIPGNTFYSSCNIIYSHKYADNVTISTRHVLARYVTEDRRSSSSSSMFYFFIRSFFLLFIRFLFNSLVSFFFSFLSSRRIVCAIACCNCDRWSSLSSCGTRPLPPPHCSYLSDIPYRTARYPGNGNVLTVTTLTSS